MSNEVDTAARVTVRNMTPEEYPTVKEIVVRSFGDHLETNPGALDEYQDEPWYDPEHLLVAELDGKLVSQMGVRQGDLWISGHAYPAGLVGTVCTLPEYRGRGIGAAMLRRAGQWMGDRGIALSYLHTSEARYGFYGRSGYRLSTIEQPRIRLQKPDRQPHGTGPFRVRPAAAGDAAALNRIYRAHFGRLSGGWSRTESFWQRRLNGRPKLWLAGKPLFTVAEESEPVAYVGVVREEKATRIIELAAVPGKEASVAPLAAAVLQEGPSTATAVVGTADPIRGVLASFQPVDETTRGRVLVRAENAAAFVRHATRTLTGRADCAGLCFRAVIREIGENLEAGSGGRRITVEVGESDLCALVYNGRRLADLLESGDLVLHDGEQDDLGRVFPDTHPSRCLMDGY